MSAPLIDGEWWDAADEADRNARGKQDCAWCRLRFRPVERESAVMSPLVGWACSLSCAGHALSTRLGKDEEEIR